MLQCIEANSIRPFYSCLDEFDLQGQVIAVVYSERNDCIRVISARKAIKYEQRTYFQAISD